MNLQVMSGPAGQLLWTSASLPGSVHDMKAAWVWGIEDELAAAGLPGLGDKGYQGAAHLKTPYKGRNKPEPRKRPTAPTRNSAPPANAQTHSSKYGRSSPGYAAAPAAPARSPKPSTSCKSRA